MSRSGRVRVKRKSGTTSNGGYKGTKSTFDRKQSKEVYRAIVNRERCTHPLVIHYHPAIKEASHKGSPITQAQQRKHLEHFWKYIRRWRAQNGLNEALEYVWVREFQGKPYCHFHVALSEEIPASIVRDCWHRAVRSTHPNLGTSRSCPWVGYSRRKYKDHRSMARYYADWKKERKDAPNGTDFVAPSAWGASVSKGERKYKGSARKLAPLVRDLDRLGKSRARKLGYEVEQFQTTDVRGNTVYVAKFELERTLAVHDLITGVKRVSIYSLVRVQGTVKASKTSFEKSNDPITGGKD